MCQIYGKAGNKKTKNSRFKKALHSMVVLLGVIRFQFKRFTSEKRSTGAFGQEVKKIVNGVIQIMSPIALHY